jgi:LysR family nitrogen assimilation transcriptional regulator
MTRRELPALDIRHLYYFLVLAEMGSISASAASLGLAQPSLSENIARLEHKLGVQLIVRGARGIHLTQAGVALLEHARQIVHSAETAIAEIRHLGGEPRGPVSVGLPPTLSLLLTVPLAETVHSELTGVRLRVAEAMSSHILELVASGQLDFGCAYETGDSTTLSFKPLLSETLFLATAPDNLPDQCELVADGSRQITGGALQQLPLILPSIANGARRVIDRYSRGGGLQLNVSLEIDSLTQIIAMVSRASGYSILPHAAVIEEVATGKLQLIPIIEPTPRRTAYVVRRLSRPVTRASLEIEETMHTIIREMVVRFHLETSVEIHFD